MGMCPGVLAGSPLDLVKSKRIDAQSSVDQQKESQWIGLLLLGTGESGKSTMFKQFVSLYGHGYDETARMKFKSLIIANILLSMRTLIDICGSKASPPDRQLSPDSSAAIAYFAADQQNIVSAEPHIRTLLNDPGVQNVLANRSLFELQDSFDYFVSRIPEIVKPDYLPNQDDVLRSRVPTTGIVRTEIIIKDVKFKIFDVGGQRNERKKWIHCFDDVSAILFVVAMSEYDQRLFETHTVNRMTESLQLFDDICNSPYFKQTSIVLFLNKADLFAEKIRRIDLNTLFPDYTGGCNYESAAQFLKEKFLMVNHNPNKIITVHFTTATDRENINKVFYSVKEIILADLMAKSGIM